jgi:TolA-binding protein
MADALLSEHGRVHHAMKNITVRLDEDLIDELEREADEHDVSRSEYIRNTLATRDEHDATHDEYEQEINDLKKQIDELETENERMRNEKRQILEQREENTELVEYVQEERKLQQRREERLDAPVWRRAKWWLVGRSQDQA